MNDYYYIEYIIKKCINYITKPSGTQRNKGTKKHYKNFNNLIMPKN